MTENKRATRGARSSLKSKVERLRTSVDETQKYELLTTNQYLKQMELVIEILDYISHRVDTRSGFKKATSARFGAGYD